MPNPPVPDLRPLCRTRRTEAEAEAARRAWANTQPGAHESLPDPLAPFDDAAELRARLSAACRAHSEDRIREGRHDWLRTAVWAVIAASMVATAYGIGMGINQLVEAALRAAGG